jgi:4-hydroxy-tetrahydrodipicolinate reductase
MLKIGLFGANGRMGEMISAQIKKMSSLYELKYAVVANINQYNHESLNHAFLVTDKLDMLVDVDVVIDFSNTSASLQLLTHCVDKNIPLVIGTTGFDADAQNKIKNMSGKIPILYSSNMSLSVNVLFKVAETVATKLRDFEVEIIEAHHRYKKDAPSGTALKLGEVIAEARGIALPDCATYQRHGEMKKRTSDEIGFSVIRGGDIVGMHEAMFIADGEVLSLKSQINNRVSFANGALLAAKFVATKNNGLYSMFDVLGL